MKLRIKGFNQETGADLTILDVPFEAIIRKVLPSNMVATSVGLVMKKGENEIVAMTNCLDEREELYPSISVSGESDGLPLEISCTELPNADHNHIVTYLLSGETLPENDDWLVSIHEGMRQNGDTSRRVIYVDDKLATGISARTMIEDFSIPVTEKDADRLGIVRVF